MPPQPKAILFDIGGVCVLSPFLAISRYEQEHRIPASWINTAISRSGPTGSWARLERGEIPLDDAFFRGFQRDLHDKSVWKAFLAEHGRRGQRDELLRSSSGEQGMQTSSAPGHAASASRPPRIDVEALFWAMMGAARTPDPHIWPAVLRLRAERKDLLVGALSNTVPFPPDHELARGPDMSAPPDAAAAADERTIVAKEKAGEGSGQGAEDGSVAGNGRDLAAYFDVFVASAREGLRKPEPRIYELAVRRLDASDRRRGGDGVSAAEVVFLDDIGANLKPAREMGMQTVLVRIDDTAAAVRELERIIGGWKSEGKGRASGNGAGAKL